MDIKETEIAQIILLARRAPLKNMDEAEHASALLQKLGCYFKERSSSSPKVSRQKSRTSLPMQ